MYRMKIVHARTPRRRFRLAVERLDQRITPNSAPSALSSALPPPDVSSFDAAVRSEPDLLLLR